MFESIIRPIIQLFLVTLHLVSISFQEIWIKAKQWQSRLGSEIIRAFVIDVYVVSFFH